VNWDPVLGTAVSDLEVDSEEEPGRSGKSATARRRQRSSNGCDNSPRDDARRCCGGRESDR
jgi:hypothetical protein